MFEWTESLRTESPLSSNLQFHHHYNYDPSCDSSLASTDIPIYDDGKGIPGIKKLSNTHFNSFGMAFD